jgi:hypothetical protein
MEEKNNESKNWATAYIVVIGFLFVLIILFYFFTKQFA